MRENRDIKDYLKDIIDNMNYAVVFLQDISYEGFSESIQKQYEVNYALLIIGEATKKIPGDLRSQHPEIPWQEIAGIRDKIAHDYFGIDTEKIWKTVKEDIPAIKPLIEKIFISFIKN